ncbi:MAG: glycoside hydrolase family 3 N-terminal domain-containing protein, partial [Pseudomonadota bacterium]
ADIAGDRTHPFLLNRCYGRTVDEVAIRAAANADGCLQGGVLPVMKHMPGHGRGAVDSHYGLPRVTASFDNLDGTDFEVFRRLRDLPLGMSAHVVYEQIDDAPGTISAPVVQLIREQIGFEGLLMTDDISMGALPGTMGERCTASLQAGCDVILHCNGERSDMEAVCAVSPALQGQALTRADRALIQRQDPVEIDLDAAKAELARLTG